MLKLFEKLGEKSEVSFSNSAPMDKWFSLFALHVYITVTTVGSSLKNQRYIIPVHGDARMEHF